MKILVLNIKHISRHGSKILKKIKENYEKQFEVIAKLEAEKQQLSAYVEVLEKQLDLLKTIIEVMNGPKFPVFKRGDV